MRKKLGLKSISGQNLGLVAIAHPLILEQQQCLVLAQPEEEYPRTGSSESAEFLLLLFFASALFPFFALWQETRAFGKLRKFAMLWVIRIAISWECSPAAINLGG
jgi:hypothetical protein